jgi:hypothetical protein
MALGGGIFTTQNKVLPGAYINFVSAAKANAQVSDRGYAAIALELDWGLENAITEVTSEDFQLRSTKLFGYDYTYEGVKPLRELFLNAKTVYLYRLNSGGTKASNTYATARYGGTRGNDITIVIEATTDGDFEVTTRLRGIEVDSQTVSKASELVTNDYVKFTTSSTLKATAGTPLTGGTNGEVTGDSHSQFLSLLESYSFNTLGCASDDDTIKALYISYTKRMRDEVGSKFQCVVYNKAADYEGVINVKNRVEAVYWVTGATAGCAINKSNLNKKYDGEYDLYPAGRTTEYTQAELEKAIKAGEYVFHRVGTDVRVLEDINSLVTTTDTKGEIFKENQTVIICDNIANDIADIFNTRYLGVVPNDNAGRTALWGDIVKYYEQLADIRAIEDFDEDDVTVAQGDSKKAVVVNSAINVVNAMGKLYMTVTVS